MTPEQLVEQLREALGPALKSVVLYGSAAAGDFVEGRSDYNILVVADPLGLDELGKLAKASKA
ncbi:MAG: nucleotidyltransferase domain-containing protein [Isosphaeraceae bacterium]